MLARYKMATEGEVSLTFLFGPWKFPTHRHPAGTDCTRFESPLGVLISLFSKSKAHKNKKKIIKKMLHCTLLSVELGVSGMFLEMLPLFQIKITW